MADYNVMKVPELKKLLVERGLTQAGNKSELIARLREHDKAQEKTDDTPAGKIPFHLSDAVYLVARPSLHLRIAIQPLQGLRARVRALCCRFRQAATRP